MLLVDNKSYWLITRHPELGCLVQILAVGASAHYLTSLDLSVTSHS